MRIVVTGGAGFLGSNLCEYLLKQGHEVICVDNLLSGQKSKVAHLLSNNNFTFLEHDITKALSITGHIDRIYNLACPASPVKYQEYPVETLLVSTRGIHNILEFAREKNARILQASTSEVYGDPLVHPQHEEYWGNVNPNGLRSCYDEGKRVAESFMMAYHHQFQVQTRIVRIFNTYGPRMSANDGRVVPNFITQALSGKPLTVYGDGMQTRSLCYVDDLIKGIALVMESDESRPVNLGNPQEMTVIDLAKEIIALTKSKSSIVMKPLPSDDPMQRSPVIDRAKKLGWQPTTARAEGLKKTIEYFSSIQ